MVNKNGLINALRLRISGGKGWYIATCPFCKKRDKLGVIFVTVDDKPPRFHCFKCKRGGYLDDLAKLINRADLIDGESATLSMGLDVELEDTVDCSVPEVKMPIGFRRTYDHEYLLGREMTGEQLERYVFGFTRLDKRFGRGEYVLMQVSEGGKCVGYLGRSIRDKSWIDAYNEENEQEYLRYRNSEADFGKLVYGIDDLTGKRTAIAVEGVFDKHAVDRKLDLYRSEDIGCISGFGAKLTECQLSKIADKGVEELVFLFDEGTVTESKSSSKLATRFFRRVMVAALSGGDPDEVEPDVIQSALLSAIPSVEFFLKEVDTKRYKL